MKTKTVSNKCRYALRAIFELAYRNSPEPVRIGDIAAAQEIPARFLEVIMAELKHGGFVESRRGNEGGYILARPAASLTVGEVLDFLQGTKERPLQRFQATGLPGDLVFAQMWQKAEQAVEQVYMNTTFAKLVEQELAMRKDYVPNYAI